jgi:hypothetical protein
MNYRELDQMLDFHERCSAIANKNDIVVHTCLAGVGLSGNLSHIDNTAVA